MKRNKGCLRKMIREFQIMLLPETYAKPFKFQEESSPGGNHSLHRPGVDDTQQNAQTELSCPKRGPACCSSRPTELQQARAGVLKLAPHGAAASESWCAEARAPRAPAEGLCAAPGARGLFCSAKVTANPSHPEATPAPGSPLWDFLRNQSNKWASRMRTYTCLTWVPGALHSHLLTSICRRHASDLPHSCF